MQSATASRPHGRTARSTASTASLTPSEIRTLGLYRQAVQLLRQSNIPREQLDVFGPGQARYELYKTLSIAVGDLVASIDVRKKPASAVATTQIAEITSSKWEVEWHGIFHEHAQVSLDAREAA